MKSQPFITVVIPVYNEQGNIKPLFDKLNSSLKKYNYEIIYVSDGSTDKTNQELKELSNVTIIEFRKNFGQTAALLAGIRQAKGEIIVTLDGDGQNDPHDIPRLINKLESEQADVVSGWRKDRQDPFSKKVVSRGADKLRKILLKDEIHDSGCTLKAYKSECFKDLDLYGEMHRFIPAILSWKGFKITEITVKHHPRTRGKTKYNFTRTLKGLIDMINVWFWYRYSARPLHLFGGVGILFILLGSFLFSVLGVLRLLGLINLSDRIWPLISFFLLLSGIQLFVSGILADIAIKSYYAHPAKESYSIKKVHIQ